MAEPVVVTRREGALLYITLNRAEKRNAINHEVLEGLAAAGREAERDTDARAVILNGEGAVFSAGVDFMTLAPRDTGGPGAPLPFRAFVAECQATMSRFESLEKPVICAIHRYAGGLGLELALACDFRVATRDTELGLPEVRVGLIPDVGGTTRLTRTVGYAKAKELIMTGRMISAEAALAIGLVNEVVAPGEHVAAAERLAREIMHNAPLAVGLAKKIIDRGHGHDKATFMELEALAQSVLVRTEDFREGARALAERRPPSFKGR
jgi:enoyl-CoA hydratase/carnithine racemase